VADGAVGAEEHFTKTLATSFSLSRVMSGLTEIIGKSGTAQDMYVRGKFSVQRSWRLPFLPITGKRGRKDKSKPVAQIKESTSATSPVAISMPVGTILAMFSVTTRTFSFVRDSRYRVLE
jgi:hypothetical protein